MLICNFHVCALSPEAPVAVFLEPLSVAWFQWHCFCEVVLRTVTWQDQ